MMQASSQKLQLSYKSARSIGMYLVGHDTPTDGNQSGIVSVRAGSQEAKLMTI